MASHLSSVSDPNAPSVRIVFACLCKSVRFETSASPTALPITTHVCHCSICRRTHGTLFTVNAQLPSPEPVWIPPSSLDKCVKYRSSRNLDRMFCGTCGTHVLDYGLDDGGYFVSTAIVESVDGLEDVRDASTTELSSTKGAESVFDVRVHVFSKHVKDGGTTAWWRPSMKCWDPSDEQDSASTDLATTGAPNQSAHITAHCHCGGVRFFVRRPDPVKDLPPGTTLVAKSLLPHHDRTKWFACNCYCDSCRLAAGVFVAQWFYVPLDAITLTDQPPTAPMNPAQLSALGTSKSYKSSNHVTRTFCGVCGATVFHFDDRLAADASIAVGLLDAPGGVRADEFLKWRTVEDPKEEQTADGLKYHGKWVGEYIRGLAEWGKKTEM
ncbi:hypothetical protein M427DRAFT_53511 [Gonapodya prolifera JEL478]|uniref:CENP-V/GFA domain-containing protein n=1 Tax=Gonapodya prolifera (strain JEL478) TaxID=1344416 RepID=A0A139AP65_GONPJ|nr:hypothetical protein M427DRAFT_53511 [Gonapodya prolifera JEL478]|eukprot:KXS18551.1 hypothetical protein M427DRAFT_53511 [Gonapodya prolifera JEL478]